MYSIIDMHNIVGKRSLLWRRWPRINLQGYIDVHSMYTQIRLCSRAEITWRWFANVYTRGPLNKCHLLIFHGFIGWTESRGTLERVAVYWQSHYSLGCWIQRSPISRWRNDKHKYSCLLEKSCSWCGCFS